MSSLKNTGKSTDQNTPDIAYTDAELSASTLISSANGGDSKSGSKHPPSFPSSDEDGNVGSIPENYTDAASVTSTNSQNTLIYDLVVGQSCLPKRLVAAGIWDDPPSHRPELTSRVDCGEDAFFVADALRYSCLGIADGVGGWNSLGVNPALFAWELMECSRQAATSNQCPMPWQILHEAYEAVQLGGKVAAGSSTACLLTLDKESGILHSANLGDSGFWVFRFKHAPDTLDNQSDISDQSVASMDLVHESQESQHHFNAPFQLAILPSHISEFQRKFFMADKPDDASVATFGPLQHGDIIVMATDGLFDNLYVEDVAGMLMYMLTEEWEHFYLSNDTLDENGVRKSNTDILHSPEWRMLVQNKMEDIAKFVVKNAAACAASPRLSPFSKRARQNGWLDNSGGKVDDITVLTAFVVAKERELPMALL